MSLRDDQLIDTYIELNPHKPWVAEARLKEYGIAVWALVGHLPAVEDDIAWLASDYDIPSEAVEAALVYYRRHQTLIDARLAANRTDQIPSGVLTHTM
jgi:uncharacterized protein (DUF433 family)